MRPARQPSLGSVPLTEWLVTLVMVLAAASWVSCSRDRGASDGCRDWVFVYYLSYDNDLTTHTPLVLKALRAGVKTGSVAVTALVDDADRQGLIRHVITAQGSVEERLPTDDSAGTQVLSNYLAWVRENLPARHYGIVFADHGGWTRCASMNGRPDGRCRTG